MIASAEDLMGAVRELDRLSKELYEDANDFGHVQAVYEDFIEDFEADLWERSLSDEDVKWPAERVRLALAHKAMDRSLYDGYRTLKRGQARTMKRISELKEIVAAHRSLVSAAKSELEASEGPQPQWRAPQWSGDAR